MKTILCYGDSNTYGYDPRNGLRYLKENCWPSILQKELVNDYDIVVEGLNGRTTAFDREGSDDRNGLKHFKPIFNSHYPIDILIFMLGTNDCQVDINVDEYQIKAGMEKLIIEAQKNAMEKQGYIPMIILICPASILDNYQSSPFVDMLNDESIRKSKALANLYKELANEYHCIFLDCSNSLEVSKIDSEHLTLNGHKQLANKLKDVIINL